MRLVTAVTTLIQLKRPNYFRPKIRSQKSNFVRAARSYRQRVVRVSRAVLAARPAISGLPPMTGHSQCPSACVSGGPRVATGIFCKPSLSSGRQQANSRALTYIKSDLANSSNFVFACAHSLNAALSKRLCEANQ
jgi:hypothetical protein